MNGQYPLAHPGKLGLTVSTSSRRWPSDHGDGDGDSLGDGDGDGDIPGLHWNTRSRLGARSWHVRLQTWPVKSVCTHHR